MVCTRIFIMMELTGGRILVGLTKTYDGCVWKVEEKKIHDWIWAVSNLQQSDLHSNMYTYGR